MGDAREFLYKTVTLESDNFNIRVARTRNSDGFASIEIAIVDENEMPLQKLEFNNNNNNDSYEQMAIELSELLDDICKNPCLLPAKK
jgi:hypothetical protein